VVNPRAMFNCVHRNLKCFASCEPQALYAALTSHLSPSPAGAASFSAKGLDRDLEVVLPSPLEGCPLPPAHSHDRPAQSTTVGSTLSGRCIVVFRGGCSFEDKATRAKEEGASALLVINSEPGMPARMARPASTSYADAKSTFDFDFPICMVRAAHLRGHAIARAALHCLRIGFRIDAIVMR